MIITEPWLYPGVPDTAIKVAGCLTHHSYSNKDSGKSRGGGLCIYVNNNWCTNTTIIDKHGPPDLEYLGVKCRPFYSNVGFSVVISTAVYIPPDANANVALTHKLTTE